VPVHIVHPKYGCRLNFFQKSYVVGICPHRVHSEKFHRFVFPRIFTLTLFYATGFLSRGCQDLMRLDSTPIFSYGAVVLTVFRKTPRVSWAFLPHPIRRRFGCFWSHEKRPRASLLPDSTTLWDGVSVPRKHRKRQTRRRALGS